MKAAASENMGTPETDKTLQKYLLGALSDEECERIERRYLADKDFFDELLAVEDDLMDDYVRGELSADERQQFEKHLLATPGQREKLMYAQILSDRMPTPRVEKKRPSPERRSWFSFFSERKLVPALAISFAVLGLTAGGVWLFVRMTQLERQIEQMSAERSTAEQREQELQAKLAGEQQEKDELLRQLQQERETGVKTGQQGQTPGGKQAAPSVITLTLIPALMRSGNEATAFTVPHDIEAVQLGAQLVDSKYNRYRAELQTADGESVYTLTGLKARQIASSKALLFRVPASLLKKRDYILKVSGITREGNVEDAGFYSFRITRK